MIVNPTMDIESVTLITIHYVILYINDILGSYHESLCT